MDRSITYIGQSIYEWLFSKADQNAMVGIAKLSEAALGSTTRARGFACSPTSPASMQVSVAPGEIYMQANLEASTLGTLPADTTHQVLKQGISLDAVLLTCAAPVTAGQSINYLIQATYQDTDVSLDPTSGSSPVVLQFYNSSNPSQPYSGPNNTGLTSNTFRKGSVVLTAKAGASATTGSQTTPAPDAGYAGLWVVTVAYGATTITSGNISSYSGSPLLLTSLGALPGALQSQSFTAFDDTGAANAYVVTPVPAIAAYAKYQSFTFKAANANTGASTFNVNGLGAKSITRTDGTALQASDIPANSICRVVYDGTNFQLASVSGISVSNLQDQTGNYAAASGTNTLTATFSPALTTHLAGRPLRVLIANANTGAVTFNPNGIGAKNVVNQSGVALEAGDLAAGGEYEFYYDGTNYQVRILATALTKGYVGAVVDDGTKSSGTYTPTPIGGNFRKCVNGGAFTLAAPTQSGDFTMIIQLTNNASAGAITTSGFTKTTGDAFTTTNTNVFLLYIAKVNGSIHLSVVAMQ